VPCPTPPSPDQQAVTTRGLRPPGSLCLGTSGAFGKAGIVPASFCSTPGWTRTSDPGIRNLRRDNFACPEETTKCDVSRCRSTTSESMSGFASTASFTAQRAEKAADLRIPQIEIGLRKSIRPDLIRGRGSPPDGVPLPERESPQERSLMTPTPRRFSEPDRAHRFLLRRTAPSAGQVAVVAPSKCCLC